MSYILDALRKAENERRREQPQPLDELVAGHWQLDDVGNPVDRTAVPWKYGLFVLLLVALAVAAYFLGSWQSSDVRVKSLAKTADQAAAAKVRGAVMAHRPPEPAGMRLQAPAQAAPSSELMLAPELHISGHVFIATGSPLNRVFIGANSYRQGDIVDGKWRIGQIKAGSLLLVAEGQEVSLSLRH